MVAAPSPRAVRLSTSIARASGLLSATIGIGVLWFGWLLGNQRLTDLVGGAPSMKANTALSIAIAGISLLCLVSSRAWIRHAGRVLAIGCALIGAATLFEYAISSELGIDQAIARDEWTTVLPGRMTILTAANVFAIGLALFAVPVPGFWPSQVGAAAVATAAFVTLIGYAYDSTSIFRFGPYASTAVHTAATLGVLAAGVFAARPHDGLARLLGVTTPGGRLARRFIPFAVVMPAFFGWLRLQGERFGWYDTPVGVSLFAITVTLTLILLTLRSASWIDRSEQQQHEAEQEIEDARRQASARAMALAAVVDASDDAIIATSSDGTITTWNPGAERLYGYTADEAIGMPVKLIVPRERHEEVQRLIRKAGSGESTTHLQTVRQTKAGNLVDVSLTVSPIRTPEGTITGASAIARDITELRQVNERFRLAFDAAPSGMLLIDRQGRIVLVNTEIERMFGYTRWELVGRSIDILVPDEHHEAHAELREGFLTSAEGRRMGVGRNVRGRRKDGTEFPAEIGLNPLITRDGLLILSVVLDVSERHVMLHRLEAQRSELQRSNDELMQFAYVASHDLQEPLRMVASYTELLESRYKGRLDERADKYIRYISEGATRMQRLIRDLLAYARVGTRSQAKTLVDLNLVARRVVGDLRKLVSESNAEVVIAPLPTLMADETQMGQLLQNLIGNAIKFRSSRPPRITVSATRDDGAWRLTVEDNGIGIDPQYHDRVFEIFQRLHDRASYEGSGVGLAVVKRIAERHGGRVWFESSPGEGSRFYVTLAKS